MAVEPRVNTLLARLDWAWRLVMTGFCFALFGIGGLLLSVVWFNLLLLLVWNPVRRRRLARRSIAASFRAFLTVAKTLGVLDYRIEGSDVLRQEKGCLVVANHPTLIDYVLLASVMPETDCLVKSALLKNPFVSGVIRAADYLINSQADALLPACQQRLDQGDTILIFPEGTRTRPGEKMTLQRGAANIAVRCGSDLRVVTIHCSEHLLDKQSKWYDVPPAKPLFTVEVRERIAIDPFNDANLQEPALAARQLNRHLLLQLQPGATPLSGINDASALP
ncbi:TPA: lysophospholipid acyltransferase family protein [Citrobacter koseri]|uniref:lysophospholipid acyltransferase family protein n=2 Tax=Enterobacterales TaxID=91347 RepID=UPI000B61DF31|nr:MULTISPECIES: lysophospholipid acyltransferase family protein [Citrobacter]MDK6745269.1 lysophospholipid acyltransferase family protein [Citrobacter sp. UMB8248A]MDE9580143.1 1-acyl-sn-glycerol-3-phosphate acyltransferase [Citrobacter koseri]MDI9802523.1 lysophospholipid acyltransferase family protein [Citrobacter koseri]MDK8125068.1 lysophospholipid acyltransferase family protein [Citrobacter koseri]MDM2959914.1 1-acyl-sn-glycerol-3-phosphate acyltransferase [Citrobacter sp. CK202]